MLEFNSRKYYIMLVSSLVKKEVIEWGRGIKNGNESELEGGVERKINYTQHKHQYPVLLTVLGVNRGINEGGTA